MRMEVVGPVRNPVREHRVTPCFPWFAALVCVSSVCVFITAGPIIKDVRVGGRWGPGKCVFITVVPVIKLCVLIVCVCLLLQYLRIIKLFAWGRGIVGGHVLRETTSRGLCGLVCPSHSSEHGGEGDCVKEGGGGNGERERERALEMLL
jgi:hypothetical protein